MKQITVRLEDGVHRAVKVRAATDGLAMEALARVWFETYAVGGTITAESPLVSPVEGTFAGGLGAGDAEGSALGAAAGRVEVGRDAVPSPAPSPLKQHRADPKTKAAQEHAKGGKKVATGLCEHRVPVGSFCRRCEEGT